MPGLAVSSASRSGSKVGITRGSGDRSPVGDKTRYYVEVITRAGGEPVLLTPDEGGPAAQVLNGLAGLLLSGGGDIHPSYYGEEMAGSEPEQIDPARDEFELALTREALARDLPVLGICRGIQVLNVALGGGLVQHLPGHRVEGQGKSWVQHRIRLAPGSKLAAILGAADMVIVNSHHHQGVTLDRLAPGLSPAAYDEGVEGLLEAVESPAHRWVIGVQWHPERVWELPEFHQRLFAAFLEAVSRRS